MPPPLDASQSSKAFAFEFRKVAFQKVLPSIVDSLLRCPTLQDAKDVKGWIKKILDYNLKGGKLVRGLSTVMAYEVLDDSENVTDKTIELSCIVGWCTEMLQSFFLMTDDIMDGSVKRRGAPSWYTLPDVGLRAVNDSVIVCAAIYYILKLHFEHMPQYIKLINLFNEALLLTSVGQLLDTTVIVAQHTIDLSRFTMERYEAIVKYKCSYYTYKLPVCAGMLLANINDGDLHRKAEEICLKIGRIFQMQDDFLDCYGLESVIGKQSTDIQEGKCSWLAVTALTLSNESQRAVFMSSYGKSEPACIDKIKKLYEELDLQNIYKEEQRTRYNEVVTLVNNLKTTTTLPKLFLKLIDEIYNRNK